MRTRTLLALLSVFAVAFQASAQDQPAPDKATEAKAEAHAIAPGWKVGKTFRMRSVIDLTQVQETAGEEPSTTKMVTTQVIRQTCTGIDDKGAASVTLKYEAISFKQTGGAAEMEWTSEKPEAGNQELGTTYKAMLAGDYTLTYDAKGKLTAVKGFDAMVQEIVKTYPENQRDGMASAFAALSDKGMLHSLRASDAFYPGKQVAVGETWDSTTRTQMGKQDMVIAVKNTLAKVSPERLATISSSGTIEFKPHEKIEGEEEFDTNPMMAMFDATVTDGKQDLEIEFELVRGIVTKQTAKQTMTMSLSMPGLGLITKVKSDTVTTNEVLPEDEAKPDKKNPEEAKPDGN